MSVAIQAHQQMNSIIKQLKWVCALPIQSIIRRFFTYHKVIAMLIGGMSVLFVQLMDT